MIHLGGLLADVNFYLRIGYSFVVEVIVQLALYLECSELQLDSSKVNQCRIVEDDSLG